MIQLNEYGFKHDYQPVSEAADADLGREYVASQRDAYRAIQAQMDAATLEEQLTAQIERNQAQITANRALLVEVTA